METKNKIKGFVKKHGLAIELAVVAGSVGVVTAVWCYALQVDADARFLDALETIAREAKETAPEVIEETVSE